MGEKRILCLMYTQLMCREKKKVATYPFNLSFTNNMFTFLCSDMYSGRFTNIEYIVMKAMNTHHKSLWNVYERRSSLYGVYTLIGLYVNSSIKNHTWCFRLNNWLFLFPRSSRIKSSHVTIWVLYVKKEKQKTNYDLTKQIRNVWLAQRHSCCNICNISGT